MWKTEHAPAHRCKICGALWRIWLPNETGISVDSWNLISASAGACCNNVPMGDQIEPITLGDMEKYIIALKAMYKVTF